MARVARMCRIPSRIPIVELVQRATDRVEVFWTRYHYRKYMQLCNQELLLVRRLWCPFQLRCTGVVSEDGHTRRGKNNE